MGFYIREAEIKYRRVKVEEGSNPGMIRSSKQVFEYCKAAQWDLLGQEEMKVIALDTKHNIIGVRTVSRGTLDSTIVHPRDVFHFAILCNAAALILVHNHPSGDPTPSYEDKALTRRIMSASEIMGIEILDHIIVAENGCYSFRDNADM